ncbi:hypothetical protein RUND412_007762 [Rhizina undulata]
MSTDYNKLKVSELREALQKRSLSTSGIKSDLIARLVEADNAASRPAASSTPTATGASTHLPTADDYEVDWDNDDETTPAPNPASTLDTAKATKTSAENPNDDRSEVEKPKKKSIAALFDDAPASSSRIPKPAAAAGTIQNPPTQPSSPSTVSEDTNGAKPAAQKPVQPSYSANLPGTSIEEELERRKVRAKRFGINPEEDEAIKKLEREKRFATGEQQNKPEVKGLDSALPERQERKRRQDGGEGRNNDKRPRAGNNNNRNHNNNGSGHGGRRQQSNRRHPGNRVERRSGNGGSGGSILDDPTEKAKAEARAKKFGVAK